MVKIYLIAGESSGDRLGADVMDALRLAADAPSFYGVGGPQMEAAGMRSLYPMNDLSVMGLVEVIKHYPRLRRRLTETIADVLRVQPDILVTIDSPDFCLRVAKAVKARSNVKTVHYVSPSIWAWRPKRAEKLKGVIDHVMTLLPFEPAYLHKEGIAATHVGHPLSQTPQYTEEEVQWVMAAYGLEQAPVLILPGSRRSEVARLLPEFVKVAHALCADGYQPAVIAAPCVAEMIKESLGDDEKISLIVDPPRRDKEILFQASRAALAASGTVSLELAAAQTPMVIAYDMSWLTMKIMRKMALIDTVTLVNIITNSRSVPEFLGERCRAEKILPALREVIANPQHMSAALETTMVALGRDEQPPAQRAAQVVVDVLRS